MSSAGNAMVQNARIGRTSNMEGKAAEMLPPPLRKFELQAFKFELRLELQNQPSPIEGTLPLAE